MGTLVPNEYELIVGEGVKVADKYIREMNWC